MSEAFAASEFFAALDARIARYDLLQHPFYQAWSKGELTHDELREYASEYWHHVAAFPTYLSALHARLEDAPLRRTVLENLADEEGLPAGRAHSDLWMDFAAGMGADSAAVRARTVQPETAALIGHFRGAMQASPASALASLYTYESRVPAIARTKAEGLKQHYGADTATARYFTLHQTADVHHANVWRAAIQAELAAHPEDADAALDAAEKTAAALWNTLSGVERERQQARTVAA
ncbi:MAG TPA: CADD family putative folate metabolism protein [Acidobacteriaceae bacterium]|jgi:pyrroloquinoline-quinone synthase|nr:CADD family putative folate metabolism protein [Acidobacteriaceae bacterium]